MMAILAYWLSVLHDLNSALSYLHEDNRVIFRDIKTVNIGFDESGILKLFDLGLAWMKKEIIN
eukprot:CAMPEP_0172489974 /NCGR_PEP_ID=MMETSP1066-20121228/20269_1 /TAXON_ID=671091 /ORGANISM="Coscinodiscus wailesii, Strain CCMP2513" /LENGTH=62 /DNA_ID=CAMNT_0013258217 /DNA_START=302 /DNA_END=490 /DNA_ORIENTATION=-